MIREDALHLSAQIFLPHREGIVMPDIGRQQIYFWKTQAQGLQIAFFKMDYPPGLHAFPRLIGITIPYLHFIHRHVPEIVHHAIAQSVSGRQEHNQHEDSPRDRKAGQESP